MEILEDRIQTGDLVEVANHVGYYIVGNIDDMPYTKPHWNINSVSCDTCYDIASEEEMTIIAKVGTYILHP